MIAFWILLICLAGLLLLAIGTFNRLVALRRATMNAWSQIDVQLKRRYDLIPNLVETVKGYMKHEGDTLERVIQARNKAISANSVSDRAAAEGALSQALSGVFALSEAYPDLKADSSMMSLQSELRGTEDKISFARQYYNDVVTEYNVKIESFPGNLFAGIGNFQHRELFELTNSVERENVKVSF